MDTQSVIQHLTTNNSKEPLPCMRVALGSVLSTVRSVPTMASNSSFSVSAPSEPRLQVHCHLHSALLLIFVAAAVIFPCKNRQNYCFSLIMYVCSCMCVLWRTEVEKEGDLYAYANALGEGWLCSNGVLIEKTYTVIKNCSYGLADGPVGKCTCPVCLRPHDQIPGIDDNNN